MEANILKLFAQKLLHDVQTHVCYLLINYNLCVKCDAMKVK